MKNSARTKFAVGYYMSKKADDPTSFSELAKRFAPRLREVYFPWPGVSNGRAVHFSPADEERLAADLKYCRDHGMKLDFLANAACYGERSCTEEQRLQLSGIIKRLDKLGLHPEIVTTTSPYIARVFKLSFPDIEVRASVNMRLRNTLALEYLAPLYDSYYICRDVQRDLPTFRTISAWCKDHGKKLCMLVNSGCMRDCPWHTFHDAMVAHKISNAFPEMTYRNLGLVCSRIFDRESSREEFLRCTWIRPEDVHVFEPDLETVKLATRGVAHPVEIVEAYLNGSYDGDLLRLTDPSHAFGFRPYRIDNKSFPADWVTSGIAGKCAENCTHCGKCTEILDRVLKYDLDRNMRAEVFSIRDHMVLFAPGKRQSYSELNITK